MMNMSLKLRPYKSDLKYSINSCRKIALILGIWPIDSQDSTMKNVIKFILNFVTFSCMTSICLSNILFGMFELKDFSRKVELTGPTSFYVMCIVKYVLILFRGEGIENCFKFVEEDWLQVKTEEQRQVMLKNAKFGRQMTIICAIIIYIGGFWYNVILPLMSDSIVTELNITVKPFPTSIYGKFFTSGLSPIYEIVFATQVLAGFYIYSVTIVSFSFAAILTMHACGQFELIILSLADLLNGLDKERKNSVHQKFISLVNSHLRVLSFVSKLEALFTEICFIEVAGCTLNLCLLGYYFIMGLKKLNIVPLITFAILLYSFLFNIFIYCYIGELLTYQARKVGEEGYMIDWYRLPKKTSSDLLFFIRSTQSPSKITAGKIIVLSLGTFSTIIRSACAYCNALWKMSQ